MMTEQVEHFADLCHNGEDAPCMASCPYGLDVRSFLEKVGRGNMRSASNLLTEQLLFPQTLCALCGGRCRAGCEWELQDKAIDLPAIEQAVFACSAGRGGRRFRVPPKQERVNIAGAGLTGLSAAYALSSLGYQVTVFEKNEQIGGSVASYLDQELYLPELESAVKSSITIKTGCEVRDLSEIMECDALIIADGAEGSLSCKAVCGSIRESRRLNWEGKCFYAGECTGSSLLHSVRFGREAAVAVDSFLKTGNIPDASEYGEISGSVIAAQPDRVLSKEEAAVEAQRCLMCDCRKCFEMCPLMQHYDKLPKRLVIDLKATLNPVDKLRERTSTRVIASCDDCGLCGKVCPENISTGNLLMEVRTAMRKDQVMPAAFHDFWLRDMEFSCSEDAEFIRKTENGFMFFPGCLLGGSDPAYVLCADRLLADAMSGCGLYITCCAVPAKWAGETAIFDKQVDRIRRVWEDNGRPCFLTACPSCKKAFQEFLPEIEVRSVYTFLADHSKSLNISPAAPEDVVIFHPCASRDDALEQESVRTLLELKGLRAAELENTADREGCCGYGGHIYAANPELYDATSSRRAQSDERPYVTYCANCRDVLSGKNKDSRHLFGIIDGRELDGGSKAPTLTQRRKNRRALKCQLEGITQPEDTMKLIISDEVAAVMDRALILADDLETVIEACEKEQAYIIRPDGSRIGHRRIGMMTYWVIWNKEGETYRILNAYCHRMVIEGEEDGK